MADAVATPAQVTADPRISELIAAANETADPAWVSFEYFPPKTEKGVANLKARFERMKKQNPLFGDITWGAGGSTSELTLDLAIDMKKAGLVPNMHLTCTNMPAEKVDTALAGAHAAGIRNIVALRGDPPAGQEAWEAVEGGFTCALDLVKHIRSLDNGKDFCVSVAGYPEGHPNAIKKVEEGQELTATEQGRAVTMADGTYVCSDADFQKEMEYLKAKVDAGADFIITQMFFDTQVFLTFVEQCRSYGITVPVVPGIMLIQNYRGFRRMTEFCKSRVPMQLSADMEAVKDDVDAIKAFGIRFGAQVCRDLIAAGHKGLHLYTLNQEPVSYGVMRELGLFVEAAEE